MCKVQLICTLHFSSYTLYFKESDTVTKKMCPEYTQSEPRAKERYTFDILSLYFGYTLDIQPLYKRRYFFTLNTGI
jgi:hypothetical protein